MDLSNLAFDLKDRSGASHQYVVTPHNATQGFAVIDAMLMIGLGPIAEALFSVAQSPEAADGDTVSLSEILKHVDKESLVKSIQGGVQGVGGLSKLAPLVFRFTMRDGQKLDSGAALDIAFTQNYSEMVQAFRKILDINGFFDALAGMLGAAD